MVVQLSQPSRCVAMFWGRYKSKLRVSLIELSGT